LQLHETHYRSIEGILTEGFSAISDWPEVPSA